MSQAEILSEIERLSIFQQVDLLKKAIQILEEHLLGMNKEPSIQFSKLSMADAAKLLLSDYENDDDLAAFTQKADS